MTDFTLIVCLLVCVADMICDDEYVCLCFVVNFCHLYVL